MKNWQRWPDRRLLFKSNQNKFVFYLWSTVWQFCQIGPYPLLKSPNSFSFLTKHKADSALLQQHNILSWHTHKKKWISRSFNVIHPRHHRGGIINDVITFGGFYIWCVCQAKISEKKIWARKQRSSVKQTLYFVMFAKSSIPPPFL